MSAKQLLPDVIGPFGNPDGSRADLDDVLDDFVDFGGDPAYGALATAANDSKVRVIVGRLGAGKTVYMRRLQDFQAHQDSVYADAPEQSLPRTDVIVRACQWFSGQALVEKWMQIWERAILRSLATHVLRNRELRDYLTEEQREEISRDYHRLLGDFRRPRPIYSQVRDIINEQHTAHQLTRYLDDPLWDDLADVLAEVIGHSKPIFFYLDGVDEEFGHAPMYWLKCQEGLFYQVMRLLRDPKLGGRLHVVICIRDIVMSSVYRSEHAPRYHNEPHIRMLTWDREALLYLLQKKLQRLPPSFLMRHPTGDVSVADWLGIDAVTDRSDRKERVEDYLVRHTRLIPRDMISLANELAEEVLRQKRAGHDQMSMPVLRAVVARSAKRAGDSQLAQCANQISSDLMPRNAALHNYSELFTSADEYPQEIVDEIRSIIRLVGTDQFPRRDLEGLREIANPIFQSATDLISVLWQNGLLGYVDGMGVSRFYAIGDVEELHLPVDLDTYVLHPCLAHSVGLGSDSPADLGRRDLGSNGFGPNGFGPNGFGPNGFGPNGYAPNGAGPNGAGPNGASPNGASPNGFGSNGPR